MLVAVAATHAQTPTATLSHEGTVKCFYGSDAFKNAVAEAVDGDDITLSSGQFNGGININKAIKIQGAGMSVDTINCIEPTIICSSFPVYSNIIVEGVVFDDVVEVHSSSRFIRCLLHSITAGGDANSPNEPITNDLINCFCTSGTTSGMYSTLNIINCFVAKLKNQSSQNSYIISHNSIIIPSYAADTNPVGIYNSSFTNCIFFSSTNKTLRSNNYAYYCIGFNGDGSFLNNVSGMTNQSLNKNLINTFFKTFDGTNYNEYETFELTTAAQSTYLGDDGTQVGIYGGSMPFNPKPNNPYITKCTVAEKSTPQGTLSVDIEVKPAQ